MIGIDRRRSRSGGSALGEYGYGVVAVEVLAVPFRGGGVLGDLGMFGVDRVLGGDVVGGVDMRR